MSRRKDAFWDAKNALMTKPDGDDTITCRSCRGEGCKKCRGWGWTFAPNACMFGATGRACSSCAGKVGCKK